MAPITKDCISSPLEAGSSLLQSKRLPTALTMALEYVSERLARKEIHMTLIVIKKEVQVPSTMMTPDSTTLPSPVESIFSHASRASSLFSRKLSRRSSKSSVSSASSSSSSVASSTPSTSSSMSLSRTKYPSLPASPRDPNAVPRLNIKIATSSPALPCSTPTAPNQFGISLHHTTPLSPRETKILRHTILKAEKKFPEIGYGWLSPKPYTTYNSNPATNELIRRSIEQNEVLFASNGLRLVGLDHIYTFKTQLHAYSRTLTADALLATVDQLRLLVLAQNSLSITRAHLMRCYEWLGTSFPALVDVNQAYKTAYGGFSRTGAIDCQDERTRTVLPSLSVTTSFTNLRQTPAPSFRLGNSVTCSQASSDWTRSSQCSSYFSPSSSCGSPSPVTAIPLTAISMGESARGVDLNTAVSYQFDLEGALREDRGPHFRGPMTPNAFEDITPVTKGEWCFLNINALARQAAVETF
ncbi:hypothetical protein BJ875DRAFT_462856 [Amylocarpus encephaloides]|uniref:DUF7582 domain-containing protein n=1 Tax=Amylocarpus encephaloides TaxID=45428 RepID=A0A9P7YIT8_9HELO|nr:hypothetical protein BJ875DRAFT_462856 [Amylocarpus encephaloides]